MEENGIVTIYFYKFKPLGKLFFVNYYYKFNF